MLPGRSSPFPLQIWNLKHHINIGWRGMVEQYHVYLYKTQFSNPIFIKKNWGLSTKFDNTYRDAENKLPNETFKNAPLLMFH